MATSPDEAVVQGADFAERVRRTQQQLCSEVKPRYDFIVCGSGFVLEYAGHGRVVATGRPYTNRFISVVTIRDRKVTRWRDYLDPLAVFDALGTAVPVRKGD
jgi:ketosteroid isomerase-like protein